MTTGHYENFDVGKVFVTEGRTVTEATVAAFAGLSGDFDPLHMDKEFARESSYGQRIAHGLCTLSIVSGLLERSGAFKDVESIFLGLKLRFTKAVMFDDSIHAEFEVAGKRESTSRPGWGIVTMNFKVLNQHGQSVQEGEWVSMVPLFSAQN